MAFYEMIQQEVIGDVFRPSNNGWIENGCYTVAYKGELIYKGKSQEVAMRFTPRSRREKALKQYDMYTYLGSVHDPNIELYGIPKVYYFGEWEKFYLMAMTLANFEITVNLNSSKKLTEVDLLIALREFVRITKYMHSKNIWQDDVSLEHLLFRRDRAFIIEYESADLMKREKKSREKVLLLPWEKKDSAKRRELVREEWKNFLNSMCAILGSDDHWLMENNIKTIEQVPNDKIEEFIKAYERHLPRLIETVLQNKVQLASVLVEFAHFAIRGEIRSRNSTDEKLFYDYFDRIIRQGIKNLNPPEPVLVSWLTPDERTAAINDLQNNRTVPIPISSIPNPFGLDKFEYPEVDYSYFTKNTVRPSANTAESSGSSRRNY